MLNLTNHDCILRQGIPIAVISQAELLLENEIQYSNEPQSDVDKTQDREVTLEEKINYLKRMALNLKQDKLNAEVYNDFCDLLYN